MTNDKIDLKLVPLRRDDAGATLSIRLLSYSGRPSLALLTASKQGPSSISIVPLDGSSPGPPTPLFNLSSPFGIPSWDIRSAGTSTAVIWTKPGSAISPLLYRTSNSAETTLTRRYPMGVFQNPRFVRGEPALAITAIANEDSGNILALFHDSIQSGSSVYKPLPLVGSGIVLDGLLMKHGSGYLLFARILATGPRGPERKDMRGESIQPGILHCLRLGRDLRPAGASERPIGDTPCYEFDADISTDRVFLLSITNNGYIGAKMVVSEKGIESTTSTKTSSTADLVTPSVLVMGQKAWTALIEPTTPQGLQILIGHF